MHLCRRIEHGCVSQFKIHADSISLNRRSSKAKASLNSRSSITRGGARIFRFPRTAKDTPRERAFWARVVSFGGGSDQGASGARLVGALTRSNVRDKTWPPRPSPVS